MYLFRLGRKCGMTIGLDQSRVDRTWDYVRSLSFMYGSLLRRLWDEKNKMADNVHVAMEFSDDHFVLRLLETTIMIFYYLRFTYRTSYNQVMLLLHWFSHPQNLKVSLDFHISINDLIMWRREWRNITFSHQRTSC